MKEDLLSVGRRAYRVNQNPNIYGTFAEIGAGQEVARHFFQAGQASNTIAKTMSAYDMTFSDKIYGKGERYVSLTRLKNMLDHEFKLLKKRLTEKMTHQKTCFFTFADTVTTSSANLTTHSNLNQTTDEPFLASNSSSNQGWIGVRFQLKPKGPYNDLILHVRMLDRFRLQQQEALGILGVNVIYSAFYLLGKNKPFVPALVANLHKNRIEIDFLKLEGRDLKKWNHREINLDLVHHGLTEALIFGPGKDQNHLFQLDEILYNKPIFLIKDYLKLEKKLDSKTIKTFFKKVKKKHETRKKKTPKLLLKSSSHLLVKPTQKKIKSKNHPIQLIEIPLNPNQTKIHLENKKILKKIKKLNQSKLPVLITAFPFASKIKHFLRRYTQNDILFLMEESALKKIFNPKIEKKSLNKNQNSLNINLLKVLSLWFDNQTFFYIFYLKEKKGLKKISQTKNQKPPALKHSPFSSDKKASYLLTYLLECQKILDL